MSIALPTTIADTVSNAVDSVSTAASSGLEAAGNLLQQVTHKATPARSRAKRRNGFGLVLLLLVAVAAAVAARRTMFGSRRRGVAAHRDDVPPTSSRQEGTPSMTTDHTTDDVKGRVKEAAGALKGDDELKRSGQRDQAAAKAKEAVDATRDKLEDGIDALKDAINKR